MAVRSSDGSTDFVLRHLAHRVLLCSVPLRGHFLRALRPFAAPRVQLRAQCHPRLRIPSEGFPHRWTSSLHPRHPSSIPLVGGVWHRNDRLDAHRLHRIHRFAAVQHPTHHRLRDPDDDVLHPDVRVHQDRDAPLPRGAQRSDQGTRAGGDRGRPHCQDLCHRSHHDHHYDYDNNHHHHQLCLIIFFLFFIFEYPSADLFSSPSHPMSFSLLFCFPCHPSHREFFCCFNLVK